jgi:hypothetical protein
LGGYQRIIYSEIDASDVSQEEKDELKKLPEQISYWAHDPNDTHRDIEVFAHRSCYEKCKKIYNDLGNPTQDDLDNPFFPIIEKNIVKKITLDEFIKLKYK